MKKNRPKMADARAPATMPGESIVDEKRQVMKTMHNIDIGITFKHCIASPIRRNFAIGCKRKEQAIASNDA